jgi:hypothetical protein
MAVNIPLDTEGGASDVRAGSSPVSEALALAHTLGSVQREVENLKVAEAAAKRLAADLQVCKFTCSSPFFRRPVWFQFGDHKPMKPPMIWVN